MASTTMKRRILAGLAAATAVVGFGLMGASGAYLNDDDSAAVSSSTQHATIALRNAGDTDVCSLAAGVVNPGHTVTLTCTVKNTGSADLYVSVNRNAITVLRTGTGNNDLLSVTTTVGTAVNIGHDGSSAVDVVPLDRSSAGLTILKGNSVTITVKVELDSTADNNWADAAVSTGITVYGQNV